MKQQPAQVDFVLQIMVAFGWTLTAAALVRSALLAGLATSEKIGHSRFRVIPGNNRRSFPSRILLASVRPSEYPGGARRTPAGFFPKCRDFPKMQRFSLFRYFNSVSSKVRGTV